MINNSDFARKIIDAQAKQIELLQQKNDLNEKLLEQKNETIRTQQQLLKQQQEINDRQQALIDKLTNVSPG